MTRVNFSSLACKTESKKADTARISALFVFGVIRNGEIQTIMTRASGLDNYFNQEQITRILYTVGDYCLVGGLLVEIHDD